MVLNFGWQNVNTNIPMVINKMNSRERSRVRPRKIQKTKRFIKTF